MGGNMNLSELKLLEGSSYTSQLTQAFVNGLIEEKLGRAWSKRSDGLYEDVVGSVYAIDITVTSSSVSIKMKPAQVINF